MFENKTTLPSPRNQDKEETEKINDLLANIPTKIISELNQLTYARAKLISKKSGLPSITRKES